MPRISVQLVENDQVIEAKLLKALTIEVNKRLNRTAVALLPQIKNLIRYAVYSQPEYESLNSGKLAADFGLPDGLARINNIIEFWLNGITLKTKKAVVSGKQIVAGIQIVFDKYTYDDLIALPEASIFTEKGTELKWLEWLLLLGDQKIVIDYEVFYAPIRHSRSGKAIMKKKVGQSWSVPSEFIGTESNNFLTRALRDVQKDLDKAIEDTVKRKI